MASYRGHLTLSSILGTGVGIVAAWGLGLDWGPVFLGAGLTALGGLLPDLDSDSGVPVREVFGLAAAATPLLLFRRLENAGLSLEQTLAVLGGVYLLIRYGAAWVFNKLTVHRGMFHSLPAMLIAGLVVFLLDHSPNPAVRVYLAAGTMIGFLSHLVLDELCSIDFMGFKVRLNRYAGSALKLASPSWTATLTTYVLLAGLSFLAWREVVSLRDNGHFL
jgi:membrane-bound metal-dependent hydrolase YbcI (DUF457 family)